MLKFFFVDIPYTDYLRNFDSRIPNIAYSKNNKFVCGIVLSVNGFNYYVPISSQTTKQQTSMLIRKEDGQILSSLKFSFMFPASKSVIHEMDFKQIRLQDSKYADLLENEYKFCSKNEKSILEKANKVYKIGCNPNHVLYQHCCDFHLLEEKQQEWISSQCY